MSKSTPQKSIANRIVGIGLFGLVLAGLQFTDQILSDHPWIFIVLACFYIVLAFVLRSRLLICTLAGIVFGLLAVDTNARRQSETYRIWQPVWSIGAGVLIGLAVGFIWDRGATLPESEEPRGKKKR